MIFVTSDHHFNHANIIKFCNRPFSSVEEMDDTMIQNWNKVVGPDDWVYYLGDFTPSGRDVASELFSLLNGKILVLQNSWHHDKRWLPHTWMMKSASGHQVTLLPPIVVMDLDEYGIGKYKRALTLCHYPMAEWDRMYHGGWHVHGHTHGNYTTTQERIMDVSVDCTDFTPISIEQIASKMLDTHDWIE